MRLLVVYQHAPTPGAPGIYRHRALLAELVRRGWQVDLVSSPINYMDGTVPERYASRRVVHERIDGITHHWVRATDDVHRSFRRRARNYLTFAWNATWCGFRRPRPDVVWASSPPLSVATAGRWIARRHRRPWVLEVRDLWPESAAAAGLLAEGSRAYRVVERFARAYARGARHVIVPTPGLVEPVRRHGARAVTVVTGAIEDRPPDAATRARIRTRFAIPDGDRVFAYVGAHGVVNGLDVLLDAVEEAGRRDAAAAARIHVLMAGAGSAHAALAARLQARPIARLHLLGAVPKDEARDLLAGADVGLHLLRPDPTFEDALPTKALEYLGCHLPFITTVDGLPRRVAEASGGAFAPDAGSLAAELLGWARMDSATLASRSSEAIEYGVANYGLAASADALEAALRAAMRKED